jgi:hypothetical protein
MKTVKVFKNQHKSNRHFNSFLLYGSISLVLVILANIGNASIMYASLGLLLWSFLSSAWHLHLSMKFARIADKEAKA